MAAPIIAYENGFVIAKKIYFGPDMVDDMLCLRPETGDAMLYDRDASINYPGEYEEQDIVTSVWEDTTGQLNYSIDLGSKVLTIVQSGSYFAQSVCPDDADLWIFVHPGLQTQAEKNGYEGAYVDISGETRIEGEMVGDDG